MEIKNFIQLQKNLTVVFITVDGTGDRPVGMYVQERGGGFRGEVECWLFFKSNTPL